MTPRCENSQDRSRRAPRTGGTERETRRPGDAGPGHGYGPPRPRCRCRCRRNRSAASRASPSRIRAARRHGSTQKTPRKQRSLDSERGLATPSPDGKGEITLGPSLKIMPLDPYSTLGRSCEPAYQVDLPPAGPGACVAMSRAGWRLVPGVAAARRAARPPGRKLRAVRSPRSRNPAKCSASSASVPDDDPWLSPELLERAADVAHNRLAGRDRESMPRAPSPYADSSRVAAR